MGPVGILCVQRTLEKGRRTGFFTGIGASISDMIYCLLTGFGLSFIEEFLTRNHNILQLLGSVVLIGFGIYLFKSNPSRKLRKPDEGISDKRNILNGFLFTFSNPLIIFLIIGLFARFNFFIPEIKFYHYVVGFLGIGAGALIWWWIVTFFVAKLRSHFNLRSMWLINKIIGGIIFIFAIVGIVTAVSAMCSASNENKEKKTTQALYLNSCRGFGDFQNASDSSLLIGASSSYPAVDLIAIEPGAQLEFSFRAANLHNKADKGYPISNEKGSRKVKHPSWGVIIADQTGHRELITFATEDFPKDETYRPTTMRVCLNNSPTENVIKEGVDFFTGTNAFQLLFDRGHCSLKGGNREYKPILSWESSIDHPDSIGFFVAPGGLIKIDDIALLYNSPSLNEEITEFGNRDVLATYLRRSSDPQEGVWKVFDRSLEEKNLKMGGDYTIAIIKNGKGYDLIYLDGASVNSKTWKPGMIKARFLPTGFPDIYDVEWIDATGETLTKDIKARYESPLFTITFPYQSSTLRLRKLTSVNNR